jgi:hypothetical protein
MRDLAGHLMGLLMVLTHAFGHLTGLLTVLTHNTGHLTQLVTVKFTCLFTA